MDFDLFLSHNADEKPIVSMIAARLLDELDIRCWLDEWDLRAGSNWSLAIEKALRACRACAIFLGGAGWGDAHLEEARTALEIARRNPDFLVIPVLLPGASPEAMAVLADFFENTHRVELTGVRDDAALRRLANAVHGEPHGPPRMTIFAVNRAAERWIGTGQTDSSLLYRGALLQEAQAVAMQNPEGFSAVAARFLTASFEEVERARNRERSRNRRTIGGLSALAAALLVTTVIAFFLRWRAEDEAHLAGAEQQIAFSRKLAAETQRATAELQIQRATAANLAELGQRLYAEQPLAALRLTVEALARAPANDAALRGRVLDSTVAMLRAGRLVRITTAADKPIPVRHTDFFIVNEADRATLRRRFDGSVVTTLPLRVQSIRPTADSLPYFLLEYGYQQQELRRNGDGTPVTEFSVESIDTTPAPFLLIQYFGGPAELRRADDDTIIVPLTAEKPVIQTMDGARFFIVTYPSGPLEIRSLASGQILAVLPGGAAGSGPVATSPDRRIFAVRYGDKPDQGSGGPDGQQRSRARRAEDFFPRGNARIALFNRDGRRIQLPSDPLEVVMGVRSNQYVLIYSGRRAEVRDTDNAVRELPEPVRTALFVDDALVVRYENLCVEIRDHRGQTTAAYSNVWSIADDGIAGHVLLTYGDSFPKLANLRTGALRDRDAFPGGRISRGESSASESRLEYFVHRISSSNAEIRNSKTQETIMTPDAVASSPATSWVFVIAGDEGRLFNLADGRQLILDGINVKKTSHQAMSFRGPIEYVSPPSVSLYAWPGIPAMVIGSEPAQIRRSDDGRLLAKLPAALNSEPRLSPDRRTIEIGFAHVMRTYPPTSPNQKGTRLMRGEREMVDARTGRRRLTFGTAWSGLGYTAHATFVYPTDDRGGERTEVRDLRTTKSLGALRAVQVDDRGEWFAVQHKNARSELWHDTGSASPQMATTRLPDRAILIGADRTGGRVVIWQADGPVTLLAGDLLSDLSTRPVVTPDQAIRTACALLRAVPSGWSAVDEFVFGEPLRACTETKRR